MPTDTPQTTGPEDDAHEAESVLLEGETWEAAAWLLWTSGGIKQVKQIRDALKAQYPDAPKDTRTVRKGIDRMSQAVHTAQANGLLNANSEYIVSLEAALQEAWKLYRTADNDNARVAALKLVVDLLTKIAAAKGVVTERASVGLHGVPGQPPVWLELVQQGQAKREARRADTPPQPQGEAQDDGSSTAPTGGD